MTVTALLSTRRPGGGIVAGAMPTNDVATVNRLLAAFNQGDFTALEEVDPDARFQDEPRIPGAGWNYGHSGAVQWAVKLWQSFGRLHFDIDDPIVSGGCLIARWHAAMLSSKRDKRINAEQRWWCEVGSLG